MRTYEEVVARVKKLSTEDNNPADMMGTEFGDLVILLKWKDARPYLRPDAKQTEWQASNPTESRDTAKGYIPFAIDKSLSHRGLSAMRSVAHMSAWVWLNCNDEQVAEFERMPYEQYGMPKIKKAAELLGFSSIWASHASEAAERMADGKTCHDNCEEGCGR